jgi:hypothetical protein
MHKITGLFFVLFSLILNAEAKEIKYSLPTSLKCKDTQNIVFSSSDVVFETYLNCTKQYLMTTISQNKNLNNSAGSDFQKKLIEQLVKEKKYLLSKMKIEQLKKILNRDFFVPEESIDEAIRKFSQNNKIPKLNLKKFDKDRISEAYPNLKKIMPLTSANFSMLEFTSDVIAKFVPLVETRQYPKAEKYLLEIKSVVDTTDELAEASEYINQNLYSLYYRLESYERMAAISEKNFRYDSEKLLDLALNSSYFNRKPKCREILSNLKRRTNFNQTFTFKRIELICDENIEDKIDQVKAMRPTNTDEEFRKQSLFIKIHLKNRNYTAVENTINELEKKYKNLPFYIYVSKIDILIMKSKYIQAEDLVLKSRKKYPIFESKQAIWYFLTLANLSILRNDPKSNSYLKSAELHFHMLKNYMSKDSGFYWWFEASREFEKNNGSIEQEELKKIVKVSTTTIMLYDKYKNKYSNIKKILLSNKEIISYPEFVNAIEKQLNLLTSKHLFTEAKTFLENLLTILDSTDLNPKWQDFVKYRLISFYLDVNNFKPAIHLLERYDENDYKTSVWYAEVSIFLKENASCFDQIKKIKTKFSSYNTERIKKLEMICEFAYGTKNSDAELNKMLASEKEKDSYDFNSSYLVLDILLAKMKITEAKDFIRTIEAKNKSLPYALFIYKTNALIAESKTAEAIQLINYFEPLLSAQPLKIKIAHNLMLANLYYFMGDPRSKKFTAAADALYKNIENLIDPESQLSLWIAATRSLEDNKIDLFEETFQKINAYLNGLYPVYSLFPIHSLLSQKKLITPELIETASIKSIKKAEIEKQNDQASNRILFDFLKIKNLNYISYMKAVENRILILTKNDQMKETETFLLRLNELIQERNMHPDWAKFARSELINFYINLYSFDRAKDFMQKNFKTLDSQNFLQWAYIEYESKNYDKCLELLDAAKSKNDYTDYFLYNYSILICQSGKNNDSPDKLKVAIQSLEPPTAKEIFMEYNLELNLLFQTDQTMEAQNLIEKIENLHSHFPRRLNLSRISLLAFQKNYSEAVIRLNAIDQSTANLNQLNQFILSLTQFAIRYLVNDGSHRPYLKKAEDLFSKIDVFLIKNSAHLFWFEAIKSLDAKDYLAFELNYQKFASATPFGSSATPLLKALRNHIRKQ